LDGAKSAALVLNGTSPGGADRPTDKQVAGKLRRRHGLVVSGEAREPGYAVEDWTWEARRVRSSVRVGLANANAVRAEW